MSAQSQRITPIETWTQWEGHVVSDGFALRRLLGCSKHRAVFLTKHNARNLADAAIKLVRADAPQARSQFEHWKAAAAFSHPHLVRLFGVGQCRLGDQEFLFVVMEYAEQTLDQILRQRALDAAEVRELLRPTLDALGFLHRKQWVHGRLKPSNFLAVNDQLKLTSDNVVPIGHRVVGGETSPYDPPELKDRGSSPAGDIWSLGVTMVEALTQRTTLWRGPRHEAIALPDTLPVPFVGMVRRCLSISPADRPSVVELEAPYKAASRAQPATPPQPPLHETRKANAAPEDRPKRNIPLLAVAIAGFVFVFLWVGKNFPYTSPQPQPPSSPVVSETVPAIVTPAHAEPEEPEPEVSAIAEPPVLPETPPTGVVREVRPEVPKVFQETIKSHIYVTVRVLVEPDGTVMGALMEDPGSSEYLANLAEDAAREWQFDATQKRGPRVWLLRFDFSRDGVEARAIAR